jgi:hypothetical protein
VDVLLCLSAPSAARPDLEYDRACAKRCVRQDEHVRGKPARPGGIFERERVLRAGVVASCLPLLQQLDLRAHVRVLGRQGAVGHVGSMEFLERPTTQLFWPVSSHPLKLSSPSAFKIGIAAVLGARAPSRGATITICFQRVIVTKIL